LHISKRSEIKAAARGDLHEIAILPGQKIGYDAAARQFFCYIGS